MRCLLLHRALVVALFVCMCSSMTQGRAQECGDNPMKQVLLVAKRAGRSLTHVLTLLRDIDGGAYDTLSQKFRLYAACVGLVDTGYFRKRSGATLPMVEAGPAAAAVGAGGPPLPPSPPQAQRRLAFAGHHIRVRDIEIANDDVPWGAGDDTSDGVNEALPSPPTNPPPGSQGIAHYSVELVQHLPARWRAALRTATPSRQIQLWMARSQANLNSGLTSPSSSSASSSRSFRSRSEPAGVMRHSQAVR